MAARAGLFAAMVIGIAAVGVPAAAQAADRPTASAPATQASALAKPVSGSLPEGLGAKPLAVMKVSEGRWYAADGRELTDVPPRVTSLALRIAHPDDTHALLFLAKDPPRDSGITWVFWVDGLEGFSSGLVPEPEKEVEYHMVVGPLSPGATSLTFRIDASDRPIETNAVVAADAKEAVNGKVGEVSLRAGPPRAEGEESLFPCKTARELSNTNFSVYALSREGTKVYASSTRLTNSANPDGGRLYRSKLPLEQLKEFRVESRAYNYHAAYAPLPVKAK